MYPYLILSYRSSQKSSFSARQLLASDDEDEDVIPSTPPPTALVKKARKKSIKVKKLKDRTYVDDDGNFVTEKVRWGCA